MKKNLIIIYIFLFSTLVILDLGSKIYMTSYLNFSLTEEDRDVLRIEHANQYNAIRDGLSFLPVWGQDGKWVKFDLHFNKHFAFSLGPRLDHFSPYLLLVFEIAKISALLFYIFLLGMKEFGMPVSWTFILAGAVGNAIDKFFIKSLMTREWFFSLTPQPDHLSGVVDFISVIWFGMKHFDFFPLQFLSWDVWPIFNLADSFVFIGVVSLFIGNIAKKYKK